MEKIPHFSLNTSPTKIPQEILAPFLKSPSKQRALESISEICAFWVKECDTIEHRVSSMYAHINRGKMLRSKLMLAIMLPHLDSTDLDSTDLDSGGLDSSHLDSAFIAQAFCLCAIIELIQCASLLHDDVIDSSLLRRGRESINALYGDKSAIMLGDALYSSAYARLCDFSPEIARVVAHSVSLLAIGEISDVAQTSAFNENLNIYYQIISHKTAALIAASAKAAAILANLDSSAYEIYGYNIGMAFQIIDDILDITQTQSTLGKNAMNDLMEKKSTLPYILLYKDLDSADRAKFLALFSKPSAQNIEKIKEMLFSSNALDEAKKIARDFANSAINALSKSPNKELLAIANTMLERSF